jgi:hypothetical protein
VEKVSLTREIHADTSCIRSSNYLFVPNASARLNNSRDSSIKQNLETVGEREKGVRRRN